jgi:nitrogen regulatory protein P-II 1
MKLILAVIRPEKLAAVQAALNHPDVRLMTVNEVFGYLGREPCVIETYRGRTVHRPVSKLRVEITVADAYLDRAVEAVRAVAFRDDPAVESDDQLFVVGLTECLGARPRVIH